MTEYNKTMTIGKVEVTPENNAGVFTRIKNIIQRGNPKDLLQVQYGYNNSTRCYFIFVSTKDKHPLAFSEEDDEGVLLEVISGNAHIIKSPSNSSLSLMQVSDGNLMYVIDDDPSNTAGFVLSINEIDEVFNAFGINREEVEIK